MLVSFAVGNFRSFNEKQSIDFQLSSKIHNKNEVKTLNNNYFATNYKPVPDLLKSCAIYGSNASGKSNFIKAMAAFKNVIITKRRERGEKISGYEPFLCDKKSVKNPCEFEIDFIVEKERYLYSFSFDNNKIHHEKLSIYDKEKPQLIYEIKNKKHKFTELFQGPNENSLAIIKNTENNLFLSLNVSDGNKFLNPVFDWINNYLYFITDSWGNKREMVKFLTKNVKNKNSVLNFLKSTDLGIVDFESKERQKTKQFEDLPQEVFNTLFPPEFIFKNLLGIAFKEHQVSKGSLALFSISPYILQIFENGGVLFFDEIDAHLHPDVLIHVVKAFYDPKINKRNAQVAFTAHNDILLDRQYNLFRRDQVWFTNKNHKNLSTNLYSLSDFETKDIKARDSIAKHYRDNHFGARPFLAKIS